MAEKDRTIQDFDTEEEYQKYWIENIWDGKAKCGWCGKRHCVVFGFYCLIAFVTVDPEEIATYEQVKNFLVLTGHSVKEVYR